MRAHTMNPASRNTRQSGVPQGSPGGQSRTTSPKMAMAGMTAQVTYLWVLVALEILAMTWLRHSFRRHHGG